MSMFRKFGAPFPTRFGVLRRIHEHSALADVFAFVIIVGDVADLAHQNVEVGGAAEAVIIIIIIIIIVMRSGLCEDLDLFSHNPMCEMGAMKLKE